MKKSDSKFIVFSVFVAAILWYLLFVIKPMNFWLEMTLSITVLVLMAYVSNRDILKIGRLTVRHVFIGIFSAIALYAVFYVGNIAAGLLFPFKDAQVLSVYSSKTEADPIWIGLLLLFIIGPGEELYWRGFVQKNLSKIVGENKGYIVSVLAYAGVHVITGNVMLVIAALVCGLFWGWMYKKEKSLLPVIISHALWDFSIFVMFPLM